MENEKQNLNNVISENDITKKHPRYGISLDMGTNSIGWAVVWDSGEKADQIVVRKGKRLYGARLFEEAEDSSKYRSARSARRTLGKKLWRLNLLKGLLREKVLEEDENFFKNLHLTQIHKGSNILFNAKEYKDKDYFKDFPTIYHLRKALTDPVEVEKFKSDGRYYRFLFLAIHDMLKNRGHFLITSDLDFSNIVDIKKQKETLLEEIVKSVLEFVESKNIDDKLIPEYTDVIAEIKEYIDKPNIKQKNNYASYIYNAITGKTISFSKLFDVNEKTGLSFKKPLEDLITNVAEVDYIVNKMFSYFSLISAEKIITGNLKSLSEFKIKLFENHHNTLSMLKELFKENKGLYKKIFKEEGIYEKFIGNGKQEYKTFIEKLKNIFNFYFGSINFLGDCPQDL